MLLSAMAIFICCAPIPREWRGYTSAIQSSSPTSANNSVCGLYILKQFHNNNLVLCLLKKHTFNVVSLSKVSICLISSANGCILETLFCRRVILSLYSLYCSLWRILYVYCNKFGYLLTSLHIMTTWYMDVVNLSYLFPFGFFTLIIMIRIRIFIGITCTLQNQITYKVK